MSSLLDRKNLIWNFRPISERSQGIFIHRTLWASSPLFFNDPFEGGRDISEISRLILATENLSQHEDCFDEIIEHLDYALSDRPAAYVCFCRNASETLMWSHYADEHRGMALGFKANSSFCTPNKTSHTNSALIDINYGYDVFYSKAKIAIEYSRAYYQNPKRKSSDKLCRVWKDVEYAFHFTKAKCWEYEQESRLDADKAGAMIYGLEDVFDPPKGVAVSFKPDDLKAVVFGVSCSEHKMKTVRSILSDLSGDWRHVKIVQASKWDARMKIIA